MTNILIISTCVIMFISIAASLAFICRWTYLDAKSRGLKAGLWTVCVLIGQNLTGLIIYLLVGRYGTTPQTAVKTKKYVVSAVISFALFIVSCAGFCAALIFSEGGIEYSVNSYHTSWGNEWKYSFGFSNETKVKTIYTENGSPSVLFIEGSCETGSAVLIVSDKEKTQTFSISPDVNVSSIDLPQNGKVKIILILNDARNGDFKFKWE